MTESEKVIGPEMFIPGQAGYEPEPQPTKRDLRRSRKASRKQASRVATRLAFEDTADAILGSRPSGSTKTTLDSNETKPWLKPRTDWFYGIAPRPMRSGFAAPISEAHLQSVPKDQGNLFVIEDLIAGSRAIHPSSQPDQDPRLRLVNP